MQASIEHLTRRLTETPVEFLAALDSIDELAVINDLLLDLGASPIPLLQSNQAKTRTPTESRLRLLTAWLLHDEMFRSERNVEGAAALLDSGLNALAAVVDPPQFLSDPDRREELVRLVLRALSLTPEGESAQQAADRLTTLDSIERVRVLRDTRAAQQRIREVQAAMRRKEAEEAASAYGRE